MAAKSSNCFQKAADFVRENAKENQLQLEDQQKLQLYALFKQGTCGDCSTSCPGIFYYTEKAKWNAWNNLRGMKTLEAKRQYIAHVKEWFPASRGVLVQEKSPPAPTLPETSSSGPLNYPRIVLEIIAVFAFTSSILMALRVCTSRVELLDSQVVTNVAPILWFFLGVTLVQFVKARVVAWRLLSRELDVTATSNLKRTTRPQRRKSKKKPRRTKPTRIADETPDELRQLALQVIRNPTMRHERQVVIRYDENATFATLGTTVTTYPFTVEQVVEAYFRKYKFPLPDPNAPRVLGVELELEQQLTDYDAVYKRRLVRSRNAAPYIIRRLINSDEIQFIETSLFDKRNRIFSIFLQNKSFRNMAEFEARSTYAPHPERTDWTQVTQVGRVHIKAVGSSFLQSKMAHVIQSEFSKGTSDERALHLQRCAEIFGPPQVDE